MASISIRAEEKKRKQMLGEWTRVTISMVESIITVLKVSV
jgi:hypothetical protein